ncbi:MAG: tail fiber domain-containing protein [Saprospiraceae bacterium]|nr:tail fiber domain-containing protein [Saprospiraceae bacterium]
MKVLSIFSQVVSLLKFIPLISVIFLYHDGQCQQYTGIIGEHPFGTGVYGNSQDGWGVLGKSISLTGVRGESSTFYGVFGVSIYNIGTKGSSQSSYGLCGESIGYHAARFVGNKGLGYADIILGASSISNTGDNGVIRSDPDVSGSDIFLEGNDAVVARIDRNNNGVGNFFVTGQNGATLFRVYHNGTTTSFGGFVQNSDRNRKERIEDLTYNEVLESVKEMPIYEWQYKGQDRRHIGPMAQDFHKAFGLGEDDTTIAAIDADGVALAAIKAQQEIIGSQQEQINRQALELLNQQDEIKTLKRELDQIKSLITSRLLKKMID